MGGIYQEQKEIDPLPPISNPSLLTMKNAKPMSRKQKKLIVLHNFSSLGVCNFITQEMKDASTDIIVVSNELFCKEEIAKDFDKHFSQGCNIIEVTSLQPISIMQRIVYTLLEKNSFVAKDADHIVFTLLSEYSRGAATIVHMLTSLMQKSEDNSRTGFELAKQQLKLHIAHQKGLQRYENFAKKTFTENEASSTDSIYSSLSSIISNSSSSLPTKTDTDNISDNSSAYSSLSDASIVSKPDSDYESMHGSDKNLTRSETFVEAPMDNIADNSVSKDWLEHNNTLTDMSTSLKYMKEETVANGGDNMKQIDTFSSNEKFFDVSKILEGKLISVQLKNFYICSLMICLCVMNIQSQHIIF